jgi:hypothetical protein
MNWITFFTIFSIIPLVASVFSMYFYYMMITGNLKHEKQADAQVTMFLISVVCFTLGILILAFTQSFK